MSWQAYVDSSLVGTGHIDKAAIISIAGDSIWASTPGFDVKNEEMKDLSTLLSGKESAVNEAHAGGIHIGGERYVVTKIEGRSAYARKGRTGICAVKTMQAIIIGHYGESQQVGNATVTVEALADYLVELKY